MDSPPSLMEQRPFRFLDLPKELRLAVYERLVHRRHHQVIYRGGFKDVPFQFVIVVTDPLPPILRTCQLVRAEAASFLIPRIVPRLLLTAQPDEASCGLSFIVGQLLLQTRKVYNDMDTTEWRRDHFLTKDDDSFVRYVDSVIRLTYPSESPKRGVFKRLQIAVRGLSPDSERWEKLQRNLISSFWRYYVSATVYATEDSARTQDLGDSAWVQYGGSIDMKTWDRDWAETC
jgi:hypothetical protein